MPAVAHVGDSRVYLWRDGRAPPGDAGSLLGQRAGSRGRADGDGRAPASLAQRRHARARGRRRSGSGCRGDRGSSRRPAAHLLGRAVGCRARRSPRGHRGPDAGVSTRPARRSSRPRTRPAGPTTSRSPCSRSMWHNLARLGRLPRAHPKPRRPRAEGALSRIGPRVLLVVRQSAAAAAGLHVRVHLHPPGEFCDPDGKTPIDHYAVFMFCGLLPWTWFSSSLLEASGSLITGGNLIKKVLFPAEVLPIVSVLANMVHFFLGLLILAGFFVVLPARSRSGGVVLVSGRRRGPARVHAGAGAVAVGADRPLPRYPRPAREPADVLVFRDADRLPVLPRQPSPASGGCSTTTRSSIWRRRTRKSCSSPGRSGTSGGCWRSAWPRPPCSSFAYWVFDRLRDSFAEAV